MATENVMGTTGNLIIGLGIGAVTSYVGNRYNIPEASVFLGGILGGGISGTLFEKDDKLKKGLACGFGALVTLTSIQSGANMDRDYTVRGFDNGRDAGVILTEDNSKKQAFITTNGLEYVRVDEKFYQEKVNEALENKHNAEDERANRIKLMYEFENQSVGESL